VFYRIFVVIPDVNRRESVDAEQGYKDGGHSNFFHCFSPLILNQAKLCLIVEERWLKYILAGLDTGLDGLDTDRDLHGPCY
jgi:hypothetical protein